MSNDVKRNLIKELNKKAKAIEERRTNSSKQASMNDIIYDFMKEVEHILIASTDSYSFNEMLDGASRIMDTRMRAHDPHVTLEMIWNDAEDWRELRLQGIKIIWSDPFMERNPERIKQEYIDISQYLLDGIKD
jgi:hypothetical protein